MNYELPKYYQQLAIKPWDYAEANNLTFTEGCIIKYISRYKHKDGVLDLLKAKHCIEELIEREQARRDAENMP